MLKKKIATIIIAATRLCKCGRTVTLSATSDETICECGKVVYNGKNDNNINGETTHENAGFKAGDSSTEPTDSE